MHAKQFRLLDRDEAFTLLGSIIPMVKANETTAHVVTMPELSEEIPANRLVKVIEVSADEVGSNKASQR